MYVCNFYTYLFAEEIKRYRFVYYIYKVDVSFIVYILFDTNCNRSMLIYIVFYLHCKEPSPHIVHCLLYLCRCVCVCVWVDVVSDCVGPLDASWFAPLVLEDHIALLIDWAAR